MMKGVLYILFRGHGRGGHLNYYHPVCTAKQYSRLTQDIEQGKNLLWRRSSSYQPDLGILLAELNGDFT